MRKSQKLEAIHEKLKQFSLPAAVKIASVLTLSEVIAWNGWDLRLAQVPVSLPLELTNTYPFYHGKSRQPPN